MDPKLWERVKDLFDAAMERPADAREAFVRAAAAEKAVEQQVLRLLAVPQSPELGPAVPGEAETAEVSRHGKPGDAYGPTPKRIGPYEIQSELGRGGMGVVYLAVRDDAGGGRKRVALKVMKRGMDTDELVKRFRVEQRILNGLNHPNIATMLEAGSTDDGRPYFVMEYVEGQPIDEYCDGQRLSIRERLELFGKVCSVVHFAHQNLIVHRDLKPGNILVTPKGEPMLMDFGIAKLLNADLLGVPLATMPEMRLMTPEYASPEQARGAPITTASDVYALGVLLYELVTGRRPYQLKTRLREEMERVICEQEPQRPSDAVSNPEDVPTATGGTKTITPEDSAGVREGNPTRLKRRLSGDIDAIVLMAMRKSPRRRYASAEEFAGDIRRHLDGLPVRATPETLGYVLGKFFMRHRTAVLTAAVVMVLIAGVAVVAALGWREAEHQRKAAEELTAQVKEERDAVRASNDRGGRLIRLMREFVASASALPETLESRRRLLEKMEALQKELSTSELAQDPLVLDDLAEFSEMLADVQGGARSANEGEYAGASRNYQSAIQARRKLSEAMPKDARRLSELALTESKYAAFLDRHPTLGDAREHVEAGLAASGKGLALAPDSSLAARAHAVLLGAKAERLFRKDRKTAEAIELADRSLGLRQSLRALSGPGEESSADAVRDVTVAQLLLADMKFSRNEAGDTERAISLIGEAIQERRQLCERPHASGRFKRDLMTALEKKGEYLKGDNKAKEARPLFDEALALAKELRDMSTADFRAAGDLGRLHAQLGLLDPASPDGQRHLADAVKELRPLVERNDPSASDKRWLERCQSAIAQREEAH